MAKAVQRVEPFEILLVEDHSPADKCHVLLFRRGSKCRFYEPSSNLILRRQEKRKFSQNQAIGRYWFPYHPRLE